MTVNLLRSAALSCLLMAAPALAQTTTTPPAPPADPAPPPADDAPWSLGGIDFSGYVDAYANVNFNNPQSGFQAGYRTFDSKANSFSLNFATLTMSHDADPIGFRMDMGFGRGYEIFHLFEPLGADQRNIVRNIMQAYVSVKPKNAGGLQFDFGKFVTSAGAEPTESHLNWNYSRSLIYSLGPFYHFGARISKPVNDHWTTGFQIVNGWNNVDDNNTGKTFGFTNAFTSKKASLFVNYYTGPEKTGTNEGYRHFLDSVVTLTPHDKASFYLNYDYGYEKNIDGGPTGIVSAVAGAAKFQANDWFALSPRIEYFNDRGIWTSGTVQKIKEFTLTAEFKHKKGLMTKLEYRHDWSNEAVFMDSKGMPKKSEDTLVLGIIAYFGPK
ncbi:MAG: porin [Acidobacteria bacterium]|nr:porin [Acidobacteriota bacterium]